MSNTFTFMLLGGGMGIGALSIIRALRRQPTPLAVAIRATSRPGRPSAADAIDGEDWSSGRFHRRLGGVGTRLMAMLGVGESEALLAQLRILDKAVERHAYEKLLGATAGFLVPTLLFSVMALGGVSMSPLVALGVAIFMAVGGFFYPDLPLAEQVEKRRQSFRHALSSWLDLVTIILAGGGGIESALVGAADAGEGWAFEEIRGALRRADLTGRTPWDLLDDLGETLGIDELRELSSSVGLAGGAGAKIRQSLAAKADALRDKQAADIEASAEARTEKMIVPVTVMIVGLTLFIGFGAVSAISTDGGGTYYSQTAQP